MKALILISVYTLIFLFMISTLQPAAAQNGAKANSAPSATETKVVTVVKVKTPWYGFGFLLKSAFKNAIPTYQKAEGLEVKYFHIADGGKSFGGIYLWKNLNAAQNWFNDKWFARVREKYNTDGRVEYLQLLKEKSFVGPNYDFAATQNESCVLRVRNTTREKLDDVVGQVPGLLRMYVVQNGNEVQALLLFESAKQAQAFGKAVAPAGELFETPVLLFNK